MAQVQRRNTDICDNVREKQERRKSGIFSFTRSFKNEPLSLGDVKLGALPSRRRLMKSRPSTHDFQGELGRDNPTPYKVQRKRRASLPLSSNPPFPTIPMRVSSLGSSTDAGKGDTTSSPTTPPLEPVLKKTNSSHSIPRPHTASSTEALQRLATGGNKSSGEPLENSEGLPTPPDTPGPSAKPTATLEAAHDTSNTNTNGDVTEDSAPDSTVPTSIDESGESPSPDPDKKVSYHEDADLHIRVQERNGTTAVYSVRSSSLESVSRIWKEELASQASKTYQSTDPAYGLDVIFSIAHYKFHDVPSIPSIGNLYDVALVAEKFQAIHLLVPFIKGWIAGLPSQITIPGAAVDEDKTLVTGWLLGQAEWFSKILSNCAYNAQIGADGQLLDSEGKPWGDQPVSDDVVEIIAATRLAAIENIIKAVSEPVQKLLNPQYYPDEDIRYCHAPEDDAAREDCEQLQLGSAIMGLTKAKLWPPPEPTRINVSPVQLANAYGDVRIRRHQEPGLRFREGESVDDDNHAKCGFGHREEIESILATPAQLSTSVVKELYVRAKRSGAFNEGLFEDLKHFINEDFGVAVDGDLKKNAAEYKQTALAASLGGTNSEAQTRESKSDEEVENGGDRVNE